jgi:DNA-binding XRE family transcriptional regulator
MNKKEWSSFVSKARAKADMTLHEFGQEIGTSWVSVWRWENEYNMPRTEALPHWIKEINKI